MSVHTSATSEHSPADQSCQPSSSSAGSTGVGRVKPTANDQEDRKHAAPSGFTALPNAVLLATTLSRDARLLYALLLHHAWQDRCCFPSQATLAAELGAGETMLRTYLAELEHAGLITQRRRGLGRSNLYVLHTVARRAGTPAYMPPETWDQGHTPREETSAALSAPTVRGHVTGTVETAPPEPPETAPNKDVSDQHRDLDLSNLRSHPRFPAAQTKPNRPCADTPTHVADPAPVAQILTSRSETTPAPNGAMRPQVRLDPAYQTLVEPVRDLADDLGDGAPLPSTLTRAYHLLQRSGLTAQDFLARLEEARAITWVYRSRVTTRSPDHNGHVQPNLVPYCFAVLGRLLTARPQVAQPRQAQVRVLAPASVPVAEPNPLWRAVLAELRTIVAPSVFTRCLTGRVVDQQEGLLRVAVPDPLALHWFETALRRPMQLALASIGQAGVQVHFLLLGE